MRHPNIIFVLSDQQRADTCGCYGQSLNVTPELDKMAKEGALFNNAFTCQPVCGPARACIQTGKYASETGCDVNSIHLPIEEKTIADHFSEAGYTTAYIGKWHLASTYFKEGDQPDYRISAVPEKYRGGWKDYWLASDVLEFTSHPFRGHMFDRNGEKREFSDRFRVDAQTDWILEYLDGFDGDKPFFLFVSYLEPHHQNDLKQSVGPEYSQRLFGDLLPPGDLADEKGSWREEYPDYLGCCHSIDANLKRIREKVGEMGIEDETLFIYTSDHGSHFRTRNREYKRSCHDGSIKIPMIIRGGPFRGGERFDQTVSLIDLPPTLLAAARIPVPAYMRGEPLQKLMEPEGIKWRDHVYLEISENHKGRAVRTSRWKFEIVYDDGIGGYREGFLYDLETDPFEKQNLIGEKAFESVKNELLNLVLINMNKIEGYKPHVRKA